MTDNANGQARIHAFVRGRVQGVGFRNYTLQIARRLGVRGWVRNRIGGAVEVVAEGHKTTLEAFLNALRRGPTMAYVSDVEVTWEAPQGEEGPFRVRGTV
jgi:acylphosphatase